MIRGTTFDKPKDVTMRLKLKYVIFDERQRRGTQDNIRK